MKKRLVNWNKCETSAPKDEFGYGEISGDEDAYQDWCEAHGGMEDARANPDLLKELPQHDDPLYSERRKLEKALETLTEKQRTAYESVYREGKTQQETALDMGIAQQVVARHLSAAIRKITEFLL